MENVTKFLRKFSGKFIKVLGKLSEMNVAKILREFSMKSQCMVKHACQTGPTDNAPLAQDRLLGLHYNKEECFETGNLSALYFSTAYTFMLLA